METETERRKVESNWDPNSGCLSIETTEVLEPGLESFRIRMGAGEVTVVGTIREVKPALVTE